MKKDTPIQTDDHAKSPKPKETSQNQPGSNGQSSTGDSDGSPSAIRSDKPRAEPGEKNAAAQPNQNGSAKNSNRRWIGLIVIILAVMGLGTWGWFYLINADVDETHLELMGNIDVRQVNLAFKVDGRIDTLAVDEGDPVKANSVIATLDKRYFNDELRILRARRDNLAASLARLENGSRPEEIAQARAQTADREAALIKAKEDYHRAEALVGKGGVSKQEFDRYHSTLDSAEAQLKAAKESQHLVEIGPRQEDINAARAMLAEHDATIEQSERRLSDADLIAPNDGVILTRARERGAIVQPGETVFALTLNSPVWVRTYVDERDLGLISPNMPADVVTDTAPDRPYKAKIGFISPTAEFTPKSVETRELRTDLVYRLRVLVDNPDGGLRQGMPVTVRLQLSEPRHRTFWQRTLDSVHARLGLGADRKLPGKARRQ